MDKNEIINRINFFRSKANLSARALSNKIEVNDGYINRLESKRDFLPSIDVLLNIIQACGITCEQFFYDDISDYDNDKKLLNLLKTLPSEKKEYLIKFLSSN